jgi:hypothetical protein
MRYSAPASRKVGPLFDSRSNTAERFFEHLEGHWVPYEQKTQTNSQGFGTPAPIINGNLGQSYARVSVTHCKQDPVYVFPEMKRRGLVPNFHIHVSLSD